MSIKNKLSPQDLVPIWNALHFYREEMIPEGATLNDKVWDDICTVMAWIMEDYGIEARDVADCEDANG